MLSLCMILKKQVNNLLNHSFRILPLNGAVFFFSVGLLTLTGISSCVKEPIKQPEPKHPIQLQGVIWDGSPIYLVKKNASVNPEVRISFSQPLDTNSAKENIKLMFNGISSVDQNVSFIQGDSTMVIRCKSPLRFFAKYTLPIPVLVKSRAGVPLDKHLTIQIRTTFNKSPKFPRMSQNDLLDSVQRRTVRYFWDFAHPVSGMARERNTSGDLVTSGGTGFGIMALVAATDRNFLNRNQVVQHLNKMTQFLWTKADQFHGAFPHWLSGSSGKTIAFSANDDGADLVETSFLIQGLLTARNYFDQTSPEETKLRETIDSIWHRVDWYWFTKGGESNLYWHWSPNKGFVMNMQIRGWNECLITHVLAASSPTHPVDTKVYHSGWARNGGIKNGRSFYGVKLPLGEDYGGPLFFTHYSFLGIDPNGLSDQYANYWEQNVNHSKINHLYCKNNPKNQAGYSDSCWGLTASDIPNSYTASSPTNDRGVITPTAALSSFPYTPEESTKALEFFYYQLGDLLWKEYGFVDAFSIGDCWAATSFLAIDQGPIAVMIENYRSGLLWKNFTAAPEVKSGMKKLGFQAPYLN